MKTYRNLYPQVWSFENLFLAWRKARKGKRSRPQAARFERVQEEELLALEAGSLLIREPNTQNPRPFQ